MISRFRNCKLTEQLIEAAFVCLQMPLEMVKRCQNHLTTVGGVTLLVASCGLASSSQSPESPILVQPTSSLTASPSPPADCSPTYPGLPDTLRVIPNSGSAQIAFAQNSDAPEQRLTLLDVTTGKTRIVEQMPPLAPAGWSPSGQHLLLGYPTISGPGHIVKTAANPFWAPPNALPGASDWLAWPTPERGLLAVPVPGGSTCQILPPEEMPTSGLVLWSADGWLAWTSDMDAPPPGETFSQTLFLRPVGAKTDVLTWPLSDDIRRTYYRLLDWVPGTRLILAAEGFMGASVWADGLPLVTIDADSGEMTALEAVMPLNDEAYAWRPTRPGHLAFHLAFIESGSRYRTDESRLVLLDVTTGNRRDLTPADLTAFEPVWSPDGGLLAYAAAPLTPNAEGDGPTLERLLNGRAIYLVDPDSGEIRQVTQPGDDALDGWPQWTADGTGLLYARRQAGEVEIRVVSVETWQDRVVAKGLVGPAWCYYGGCGWGRWLAYRKER